MFMPHKILTLYNAFLTVLFLNLFGQFLATFKYKCLGFLCLLYGMDIKEK